MCIKMNRNSILIHLLMNNVAQSSLIAIDAKMQLQIEFAKQRTKTKTTFLKNFKEISIPSNLVMGSINNKMVTLVILTM